MQLDEDQLKVFSTKFNTIQVGQLKQQIMSDKLILEQERAANWKLVGPPLQEDLLSVFVKETKPEQAQPPRPQQKKSVSLKMTEQHYIPLKLPADGKSQQGISLSLKRANKQRQRLMSQWKCSEDAKHELDARLRKENEYLEFLKVKKVSFRQLTSAAGPDVTEDFPICSCPHSTSFVNRLISNSYRLRFLDPAPQNQWKVAEQKFTLRVCKLFLNSDTERELQTDVQALDFEKNKLDCTAALALLPRPSASPLCLSLVPVLLPVLCACPSASPLCLFFVPVLLPAPPWCLPTFAPSPRRR